MSNYIDPEVAARKFNSMKRYARVRDMKPIMSNRAKGDQHHYPPDALAIDCFQGPITSYTSLPYWLVAYLHHHRDRIVGESEIYEAANRIGYRANDVKKTIKYLNQTQSNIGNWRSQKTKENPSVAYLRWYDPNEDTTAGEVMRKTQACLDRGEDW